MRVACGEQWEAVKTGQWSSFHTDSYLHEISLFLSLPFTLPLLQGAQPSDQPVACWLELGSGARVGEGRWALTSRAGGPSAQTDAAGLYFCENPAFKTETDTTGGGMCTHAHRHKRTLFLTWVYTQTKTLTQKMKATSQNTVLLSGPLCIWLSQSPIITQVEAEIHCYSSNATPTDHLIHYKCNKLF